MTTGRINQVTVLGSSPIVRGKLKSFRKSKSNNQHNNRTCPSRIYLGTKALKLLYKIEVKGSAFESISGYNSVHRCPILCKKQSKGGAAVKCEMQTNANHISLTGHIAVATSVKR